MPTQRGRKSAASLAVVRPFFQEHRPAPPAELTPEQAEEWVAIVNAMPADWFDHAPELLVAHVRHVCTARLLAAQINAFDPAWLASDEGLKRYDKLLAMRERETKSMMSLATKMRLTQQSRYRADRAAVAVKNAPTGRRPWEHLS
jgi:hypothetical protein